MIKSCWIVAGRGFAYRYCTRAEAKASGPVSPQQLEKLVALDQTHGYRDYTALRKIFAKLLMNDYYEQQSLYKVLGLMAGYPSLELQPSAIDLLHTKLQPHLHRLNSAECVHCLLFLAKADPTYQQSLLYEHMVRFYVRNRYQLLRTKFKLDPSMTVMQHIRKIFNRSLTMSYGSRTPPYEKELGVPLELRNALLTQLLKSSNDRSMFVRKLYYQLFLESKKFYEQTMHENLYDERNAQLAVYLGSNLNVWCSSNPLIVEENRLIRELYCKLLLVLADQGRSLLHMHNLALLWGALQGYQKEQLRDKVLSLLRATILNQEYIEKCGTPERLRILQLTAANPNSFLEDTTLACLTSGEVHFYFTELLFIIKLGSRFSSALAKKTVELSCQLNLKQCLQLALVVPSQQTDVLMKRMLEIDDCVVTHSDIVDMLRLLSLKSLDLQSINRAAIRTFAFKYLSDNHRSFELEMYKQCLQLLKNIPDSNTPFDNSGLYSSSIHEELRVYNQSIGLP